MSCRPSKTGGGTPLHGRRVAPAAAGGGTAASLPAVEVIQSALYDATHAAYGTASSVFGSFSRYPSPARRARPRRSSPPGLLDPAVARPVVVLRLRAGRQPNDHGLCGDRERRSRWRCCTAAVLKLFEHYFHARPRRSATSAPRAPTDDKAEYVDTVQTARRRRRPAQFTRSEDRPFVLDD